MRSLHIATASLNQTPLDWEGNFRRCSEVIQQAEASGVDLLCLPELCISGYGCEDMFMAEWVRERSLDILMKLSKCSKNTTVLLGLPFEFNQKVFNTIAVVRAGKVFGLVPKQFLANEGIHYESRWFTPWRDDAVATVKIGEDSVPFGKMLFSISDVRFGIEICEDAWVTQRPAKEYIKQGVDIICNASASHFSLLKYKTRIETTLSVLKKHDNIFYAYANLLGNESGRAIYDGSSFIAQGDKVLASIPRFSFKEHELVSLDLEFKVAEPLRDDTTSILLVNIESSNDSENKIEAQETGDRSAEFEISKHLKEEEFSRAVALGMFDYMRKSRSKGFVISLSGGADSAACACLARIAFELAEQELGIETLKKTLNDQSLKNGFIDSYLSLLYLRTKNNSQNTYLSAKTVAENVGGRFGVFDVDGLVEEYSSKVSDFEKTSLNWSDHSIPLQNIQARARGPLVWFVANLQGALLLSTSNRSEAAVGYTTMDGDTCGGLSPIGGIDKAFLLSWLKWLEINENHSFGDFAFLSIVNSLSPSAELKPQADVQTDEADLMPYVVLDAIERAFVGEKKSPSELVDMLLVRKFTESKQQAGEWVTIFLNLWQRNQWKRERYAPSFHVDDQSLDPKTWFRYPILSGKLEANACSSLDESI